MQIQEIQNAAIAEILNPTLAITKQFLAVNKVVCKENILVVEDIILREEKPDDVYAEVYFPVEGNATILSFISI